MHGQRSEFNLLALCSEKSKYLIENDADVPNWKGNFDFETKLKAEVKAFENAKNFSNLFHTNNADCMLIDLIKLIVHLYDGFNVKLRLQSTVANSLQTNESYRITLDAYVQSEQKYTTVSSPVATPEKIHWK